LQSPRSKRFSNSSRRREKAGLKENGGIRMTYPSKQKQTNIHTQVQDIYTYICFLTAHAELKLYRPFNDYPFDFYFSSPSASPCCQFLW
jgi:hypothetical protein